MIFVGDDWAEAHHDIYIEDDVGNVLVKKRVPEGVDGIARFHELVSAHVEEPSEVIIGIETDRGLFVQALVASGYVVYPVNPFSVSRYRDRHGSSGAKSDPGDAKVLADLVRTDRLNHRPMAQDTELAEALKILARTHQNLIWSRQRQGNALRSTLREFYPGALLAFGDDLTSHDASSVLAIAPTPAQGRKLTLARIESALRRGGRMRRIKPRAAEIQDHLRVEQLEPTPLLSSAFGTSVKADIAVVVALDAQINALSAELSAHFDMHPDAKIILSQPGLGTVLGARVLAEFGDDPNRFADAKSRKNYAGTSPITRASGTKKAVLARIARNQHLGDACYLWAFSALTKSSGARAYYDSHRARGQSHHQALRALANRLVGILHGCLKHRCLYDESTAWPSTERRAA